MTVGAVPAVDGVVGTKLPAHTGGDALLPDAQMDEPVHLARARERADPLLEDADPPHRTEELETGAAVERPGHYAATGAAPSTCCTASTTFASSGSR